ncbi:MAG TPA: Rieske 2Fe-2S domain-containing protein [Burkholderiaceae bacterium]|nr:Rieske 2Fe-2S domain-containing protein [Burkholderiaceae bacterium]
MSWREHPDCPSGGTRLCAWADLPDNSGREVVFGEGREALRILLLRQGERHWAYLNSCPHFSLPLNFHPQTFLTMDAMVVCAHHTAFFNFDDGACVDGPCAGAGLTPVPTLRQGDDVVLAMGS